eukprot:6192141-Pleurochrysis_carterae.AAC.1
MAPVFSQCLCSRQILGGGAALVAKFSICKVQYLIHEEELFTGSKKRASEAQSEVLQVARWNFSVERSRVQLFLKGLVLYFHHLSGTSLRYVVKRHCVISHTSKEGLPQIAINASVPLSHLC